MVLTVHAAPVPTGRLARANPLAKIIACFVLGLGAALTDDPVTPALVLAGALVALQVGGVRIAALLRRAWPVLVSAAGLGLTTLVFGDSATPWLTALSVTVRVLAIALPGVAVLLTVDPT